MAKFLGRIFGTSIITYLIVLIANSFEGIMKDAAMIFLMLMYLSEQKTIFSSLKQNIDS